MTIQLKGWTYGIAVGCFIGALGLVLYPIGIAPMLDSSEYKRRQARNRLGIKQEEVQPGGMRVWSDPFDAKK